MSKKRKPKANVVRAMREATVFPTEDAAHRFIKAAVESDCDLVEFRNGWVIAFIGKSVRDPYAGYVKVEAA